MKTFNDLNDESALMINDEDLKPLDIKFKSEVMS